ncbi:MAG: hypothetical protein IPP01_00040 [Saprospiraceae bacterium]|nr:hypothetical protein [Saprospiraceae bacterium]
MKKIYIILMMLFSFAAYQVLKYKVNTNKPGFITVEERNSHKISGNVQKALVIEN